MLQKMRIGNKKQNIIRTQICVENPRLEKIMDGWKENPLYQILVQKGERCEWPLQKHNHHNPKSYTYIDIYNKTGSYHGGKPSHPKQVLLA